MLECHLCGEDAGKADVTFDDGPIGTELCFAMCPSCQRMIRAHMDEIHKVMVRDKRRAKNMARKNPCKKKVCNWPKHKEDGCFGCQHDPSPEKSKKIMQTSQ